MAGGQCHHRRLQPRPKRRRGDELWQPGAGPCAAVSTAQLMRAMFAHDHADRRQLGDLVATEPPARPALPIIKPTSASATRIREVIDDLIHLILGVEFATRTPMPGLPTSLALNALSAHQFLGLRASLCTPLSARLRRIHRRRRGARARISPCLLLEPPQPILVLLNPARQIENDLNTRLTPRVINRLRLGTIHACKIRCTNKESLPQAPTTERLPKSADMQVKAESREQHKPNVRDHAGRSHLAHRQTSFKRRSGHSGRADPRKGSPRPALYGRRIETRQSPRPHEYENSL